MITLVHLDKDDIANFFSEHFNVPVSDVFVDCYMETVGYGTNEHQEPNVRVVIHMEGEDL